jgi:hypothetical protein
MQKRQTFLFAGKTKQTSIKRINQFGSNAYSVSCFSCSQNLRENIFFLYKQPKFISIHFCILQYLETDIGLNISVTLVNM